MTDRPVLGCVTRVALVATVLVCTAYRVGAYWLDGPRWPDGSAVMHLQLGSSSGTLIDGSTSWGASAESALATWNLYMDRVQFRVVRDSTAGIALGNGISNVFWSTTIYGRSFEGYAGYTLWLSRGGSLVEADVMFNSNLSWNSYRGPLTTASRGGTLYDLRRLALHEFGHAIGLNHPDEHGQRVTAVMNASNGGLENLTGDDISGAQALYSFGGTGTVAFPPRDESLDFRNQLESKYRGGLGRGIALTYVDSEGDIVWTSEYFRYRVNLCSHSQAVTRVMSQIDNAGAFGVCGNAPRGQVAFPPRNEALDFRLELERKYRDDLRRGPVPTAVDNEGDVVWTQEYLRYRVNSCSHAVAVDKVFAQIDGRGIQPVCR